MAVISLATPQKSAESIDNEFTAEVDLLANQLVYFSGNETVNIAQANDEQTHKAIGFVVEDALASEKVIVRSFGPIGSLSGFTVNQRLYLSPTVPGGITTVFPSNPGDYIVQVGIAISSERLFAMIQKIGRRAL